MGRGGGGDKLWLDKVVFTNLAAGAFDSGWFVAGNGEVAVDVDDYIIYDTSNGNLYCDADGSGVGAAVRFAALVGVPTLTAADFFPIG